MLIPALWDSTPALVTGIAVAAHAAPECSSSSPPPPRSGRSNRTKAGLASGIVSTFHEFGASLGAAVVSSMAAASIAGTDEAGFSRGFATGAVVAAVAAVLALILTPGRAPRELAQQPDPA